MARRPRKSGSPSFYTVVVAAGALATSFALGLGVGQRLPAPIESYFSADHTDGSEHRQPIVAPEQPIPLETFTFYESVNEPRSTPRPAARVLEREEIDAADPPARTLPREPVPAATPGHDFEAPAAPLEEPSEEPRSPEEEALEEARSPEEGAPEETFAIVGRSDDAIAGRSDDAIAGRSDDAIVSAVTGADAAGEAPADPAAVRRIAIVVSSDEGAAR